MGCKINSITRMLVLSCIFPFQIYYPFFLFCSMLSEIGLCGLNQLVPFYQDSGQVWPWKSQLEVTETKGSEVKIFISLVSSHARSCQAEDTPPSNIPVPLQGVRHLTLLPGSSNIPSSHTFKPRDSNFQMSFT